VAGEGRAQSLNPPARAVVARALPRPRPDQVGPVVPRSNLRDQVGPVVPRLLLPDQAVPAEIVDRVRPDQVVQGVMAAHPEGQAAPTRTTPSTAPPDPDLDLVVPPALA
jgi:hypothetical protein